MAFMDPNRLKQIFGQGTLFGNDPAPAPTTNQERLMQSLMGMGAGMTGAQGGFAQQLGGGAAGMMQADQQFQQQQAAQQAAQQTQELQQLKMDQARQEMAEEQARAEARRKMIFGETDIMSEVDTGRATAVAGGAQPSALEDRGQVSGRPTEYRLGSLSERFESSGQGVGTISTGQDDPGGVSYGRHQLSTNAGTMQSFLESREGQAFAHRFAGMQPGTDEFNRAYSTLAADNGDSLDEAQRKFLTRTHFQPVAQQAQQLGLPVDNPAIAEALYSMSVQHSGAGNVQILNNAMARMQPGAGPEQALDALYDARGEYADQFVQESAGSGRYERERREAKKLLGDVASQGRDAVARQSQQHGPKPLAEGLGLTEMQRNVLAMMPPEQQDAFIMQHAGLTNRDPTDKEIIATRIGQSLNLDPGLVLAQMENVVADPASESNLTTATQTAIQKARLFKEADPTLTESEATNLALGRHVVSRDPLSGQAQLVDKVTGEVIRNVSAETAAQYEDPPVQSIIPEDLNLTQAMGAGGWFSGAVNTVRDAFGAGLTPRGENVERATQALNNLSIQTETALAQEIAGRPSNYLLERLRELTIEPGKILQGDQMARERLVATEALIRQKISDSSYVVNNPNEFRPQDVGAAGRNIKQLETLQQQYEVALRSFETNAPRNPTQGRSASESVEPPPEGVTGEAAELWQYMSPEDRALWQN